YAAPPLFEAISNKICIITIPSILLNSSWSILLNSSWVCEKKHSIIGTPPPCCPLSCAHRVLLDASNAISCHSYCSASFIKPEGLPKGNPNGNPRKTTPLEMVFHLSCHILRRHFVEYPQYLSF
ncbi:unnamed protein product, partial [Ectocarpus sp. 6 AP-2014]